MLELLSVLPLDDSNSGSGAGFAVIGFIVWIIVGILQVILFIAALVSILGSKRYTGGGKFLWVVLVFFTPFFGAIGWFAAGRNAQIRTATP